MQISIIIVNYNVKYYIEQCLHSVFSSISTAGLEAEVFVVDNASTDQSVSYLHQQFPQSQYPNLHIIANARNVGFSRANNQAVHLASGEYILFLNPDTLITADTLGKCHQFAQQQANFGALGVKMLSSDGTFAKESRRGLPTPWVSFCKMSGLTLLFPKSKVFARYYLSFLDKEKPANIEIISGAFMFVSNKALQQCGSFDEDFFMYGEDIDLSYRIIEGGFQNFYLPLPILHYKGESTQKSSYRYVHVFYEAMLIFFRKHYGSLSSFFTVPIKCAIIIRALIALIRQQVGNLFPQKEPELTFGFVGTKETYAALLPLAEKWLLSIEHLSEQRLTSLAADAIPPHIKQLILDAEVYTNKEVLRLFEASNHKRNLSIFSPKKGVLITNEEVFY
ncbi:MAG: glycosyltransferase family 2 protein [Bacteroidaceae bacterium]|nr:glycosyltransferase family 2 protein [Bacteroidaceae bacterium]